MVREKEAQFIVEASNTYGNIKSSARDEAAFVSLCGILGNRVSIGIIKSTMGEPKSAAGISREHCIPISSVYRHLRRLQKAGIIEVEFRARNNKNNKHITYYTCRLRSAKMTIDENGTRTQIQTSNQ